MCRVVFFFLMVRRPPRSTLDRSSAASDVYKRQLSAQGEASTKNGGGSPCERGAGWPEPNSRNAAAERARKVCTRMKVVRTYRGDNASSGTIRASCEPVSYTHLRAHETVLDLVCRLLLEKKNNRQSSSFSNCCDEDKTSTRRMQTNSKNITRSQRRGRVYNMCSDNTGDTKLVPEQTLYR